MTTTISKLKIQNFKTFLNNEFNLKSFNLIIGLNASGKSNLISVFRFLRDIVNNGLDNAISLQGGIEYLLNSKCGITKNFLIDINISLDELFFEVPLKMSKEKIKEYGITIPDFDLKSKSLFLNLTNTRYFFEIQFFETQKYIIQNDILSSSGQVFIADESTEKSSFAIENKVFIGDVKCDTSFNNGFLDFQLTGTINQQYTNFLNYIFNPRRPIKIPEKSLILEAPYFIETPIVEEIFKKLAIYDIDPKLSKKGAFISGKKDLEEDGGNLALVIKNIIKDDTKRNEFGTIVNDLLPFVDEFEVDTFAGKNLIFKMKETYDSDFWPASFLSDGTINVISLIIATNFEEKRLMIFEEPENNIHPMLIPKILKLFKESSKESQIIVTSHNPEFVKYADINDILFVKRDKEGFSQIIKPSEIEKVKTFLEGELSLDALFIRNLIGE